MVEVIYGPESPVQEMNSFLDPELIGRGRFARIQNLRWDTGRLNARSGTALYLAAPETGMTMVDLIPCSLNGTSYLLGFFLKSGATRIYMSSQGSAWVELTEVGGFSGGTTGTTRFATNTGRFTISVVKAPQGYFGGAITASRDVAIISNGADEVRLWDPGRDADFSLTITNVVNNGGICRVTYSGNHYKNTGDTITNSGVVGVPGANGSFTVTRISATVLDLQGSTFSGAYTSGGTASQNRRLTIHKVVNVPSDASILLQKATFARYWQVRGSTGKTYYNDAGPPKINDNGDHDRFHFLNSSDDVYTGDNAVIKMEWGDLVDSGSIATVYFPDQLLQLGKGLVMVTEDLSDFFGASQMFAHVKVEVNRENVTYDNIDELTNPWVTLFDPTSSDEQERRYIVADLANSIDTDLPRKMWFFPADHLDAADKSIYHLRFVYLDSAVDPTTNYAEILFLAICGAGSFRGGSEATISYEDETGRSESRRFVATDIEGAPLQEVGGPTAFASDQPVFKIPIDGGIFYDYDLVIRNSDGDDQIEGGLNGEPSRINIYFRCPTDTGLEPKALYMYSLSVYSPGQFTVPFDGLGWTKANTATVIHHNTSSVTDTFGIDWTHRQIDRFAPSDYQIAIQPHYASTAKNGRFFWGNVKDLAGQQQRGDGYLSGWGQPFRNQAIPESEVSGNRFTADGEVIQAFVSSAAGSQGVSHIHVITDKWLYPLGGSGSVGANPLDANNLAVLMPAIGRGTNAHRTVCEKDGAIFYIDNTGQQVKVLDGAREISRMKVDDKFAGVPAARVDDVCSAVFKSRVYTPYTLAGQTTNTRIQGYNDLLGKYEFDDLPPVNAERICVYYDPSANGSGQRLLIGTQDCTVYQYESGSNDLADNPIAVRLTSYAIPSPNPGKPIRLKDIEIDATGQDNELTLDRVLGSPSGTYRTTLDLTRGWVTDSDKDHTPSTPVADDGEEWSRFVQLDLYGNLDAGSSIRKIIAYIEPGDSQMASSDNTA